MKGIFRPRRDEVVGDWRRMQSEGFTKLVRFGKYYSGYQMKEDVACSTHQRDEKCIQNFGWRAQPEWKSPLGRRRCR